MTTPRALFCALLISIGSIASGCDDPASPPAEEPPEVLALEITSVDALTPSLPGTLLRVDARGFDPDAEHTLRLGDAVLLPGEIDEGGLRFTLSSAALDALGEGPVNTTCVLIEGERESPPAPLALTLARALPIALDTPLDAQSAPEGGVVLRGEGFLDASEGRVEAALSGTYTPDGAPAYDVALRLPVSLARPDPALARGAARHHRSRRPLPWGL